MDFPGNPLDSVRPKAHLKSFPSTQQDLKLITPYSYIALHFTGVGYVPRKNIGTRWGSNTMALCRIYSVWCPPSFAFSGTAVVNLSH